ncbi:MAG: branched-chain amino acid ABC transporter permease [Candidatus Bathyarchaeota archaeon]|nr:branched-chain amino acid ABC transporter permease [Candidatus Bathyarchaeota archaeon]
MALSYAGLLSLLGLAVVLRHRVSGIPDFSIVVYLGLGVTMSAVAVTLGLNLYVGPVLAFVAGCLLGLGEYRGVMGVMERRGDNAVKRSLATIGLQIIGSALLACGSYWFQTREAPLSYIFHSMSLYDFTLFDYKGVFFVVPIVCVAVYALFLRLSRRTMFGALITASGEEPELAMIQGVNPWRVKLAVWALSGGLAAVAGSLFPPFYHITPGWEYLFLVPIFAVGVLSGFGSLLIAVIAAYIVGFGEILGTLWGQINFGAWFGEYRPLISVALIYFGMLLIPRGLVEVKELYVDIREGVKPVRRRLFVVSFVVLALVGMVVVSDIVYVKSVEASMERTTAGWVNAANRVGVAGARIYPDTHDPSLPSSMYFENVYPPDQMNTVSSLIEFTRIIKDRQATLVYRHDDALYLIIDHTLGYVYYPSRDNYGR